MTKRLPLNLQFFADENADTENVETTENQNEETQDNTTFTQSDVDSQISKAVDKALKNQQKKLEQEKQQAIDDAKKDAEAYAKMTAKEKEDAEYNKRLKQLEDRERELNNKQLLSEIETDLKDNQLPVAFAQSLLAIQDNEKIKEAVTGIKKEFDEAVNNAVKEALRQDPPETGNTRSSGGNINKTKAEMARKSRII